MTSRPSLVVAGIAAAVLLSVAACSSGATQSPSTSNAASGALPSAVASALASAGSAPDAGTLVTADMAASVIGGSPTSVAPPMNIPNISIASYTNDNGDSVTVFVEEIPGGVASTQLQAAIAIAGAQGQLQPISGVGDMAGKVIDTQDATVAFVKGSTLVVVEATSSTATGSDLEPKVEALARQLAAKL